MSTAQDCQAEACDIQSCLTRSNYNESRCASYVEALYRCCDKMYVQAEKDGKDVVKSTACPIRSVVDRRIKSLESDKKGKR